MELVGVTTSQARRTLATTICPDIQTRKRTACSGRTVSSRSPVSRTASSASRTGRTNSTNAATAAPESTLAADRSPHSRIHSTTSHVPKVSRPITATSPEEVRSGAGGEVPERSGERSHGEPCQDHGGRRETIAAGPPKAPPATGSAVCVSSGSPQNAPAQILDIEYRVKS